MVHTRSQLMSQHVPRARLGSKDKWYPDRVSQDSEDQDKRLHRLETLVGRMAGELESLREEGRVVSESLVANSRVKAARARRAQQRANDAQTSADVRATSTGVRVARKRR